MAELTASELYRLESLRQRCLDTERHLNYHEFKAKEHKDYADMHRRNLEQIKPELEALEARQNG